AWNLPDFPDRMQHATDAAVAALRRAEGFASGGTPDKATRSDRASAGREVDEVPRHTRLILASAAIPQKLAEGVTGQGWSEPEARAVRRYREALGEFGLDPVHGPADEVAKAVASSRLRDVLLGMLLDWHWHGAAKDRLCLWPVIRSAR